MTTSELRLTASNVTCHRGGRLVFEGIGFDVAQGQALVLTGPNGAGKSSLLRQIAGLLDLAQGEICLDGGDAERSIGEQAHYAGHDDALKPSMSVFETLSFWSAFLGGAATGDDDIFRALDALALERLADLPVGYLSAGQRRRLALARLVAVPRPLWLLDEPTAALDAASTARLLGLMNGHLAAGGIIVAATHLELGLAQASELRLGPAKGVAAA